MLYTVELLERKCKGCFIRLIYLRVNVKYAFTVIYMRVNVKYASYGDLPEG